MWTEKIKTLNEDVVVAVLIAISTIANKPGFIWKKKMFCPNAWVFIAQLVEHCSATRHGFESRLKSRIRIFFGFIFLFLNCNYHCIYSFKIIIFIIIIIITIIYR